MQTACFGSAYPVALRKTADACQPCSNCSCIALARSARCSQKGCHTPTALCAACTPSARQPSVHRGSTSRPPSAPERVSTLAEARPPHRKIATIKQRGDDGFAVSVDGRAELRFQRVEAAWAASLGAALWPSSLALAGLVDKFVEGRSVLELGSGLGLGGAAAAQAGAARASCARTWTRSSWRCSARARTSSTGATTSRTSTKIRLRDRRRRGLRGASCRTW